MRAAHLLRCLCLHEEKNEDVRFKSVVKSKRFTIFRAGNGEHLVLLAHVSRALKLVIVSERLGLIRLAWDLNLLLCLHQCHYTSTCYIHFLMRLY